MSSEGIWDTIKQLEEYSEKRMSIQGILLMMDYEFQWSNQKDFQRVQKDGNWDRKANGQNSMGFRVKKMKDDLEV